MIVDPPSIARFSFFITTDSLICFHVIRINSLLFCSCSNTFSVFVLSLFASVSLQPVDELRTVVFEILKKKDEIQGSWPVWLVCNHCGFTP